SADSIRVCRAGAQLYLAFFPFVPLFVSFGHRTSDYHITTLTHRAMRYETGDSVIPTRLDRPEYAWDVKRNFFCSLSSTSFFSFLFTEHLFDRFLSLHT
ncbi:hypothetical protein JB92DRAFT_2844806, partial [Gautieria morchelliformis]